MYNPEIGKVTSMVQTMWNKHNGEMNRLVLEWDIVELYDTRSGSMIQQIVPLLAIEFK